MAKGGAGGKPAKKAESLASGVPFGSADRDEKYFLMNAAEALHKMGAKIDTEALADKLGVPVVKAGAAPNPEEPPRPGDQPQGDAGGTPPA